MSAQPMVRSARGFTLIEAMIVLAVAAVLVVLVGPSMRSMIDQQRLRGTSSQLFADMQFARTEVVSRQEVTGITFGSNTSMTCYIIHTCGTTPSSSCTCDCTAAAGSRCASPQRELRTVQFPVGGNVAVAPVASSVSTSAPTGAMLDPATGGILSYYVMVLSPSAPTPANELWVETSLISGGSQVLRLKLSTLGRPSECVRNGSMPGYVGC